MRIMHRFGLHADAEAKRRLGELDVIVPEGFAVIEMDEADDRFSAVREIVRQYSTLDIVYTTFSRTEISGARLLRLNPAWHSGYPMPDDDFGYLELTYDLSYYCDQCGIGGLQKAPFNMRRDPRWGKNSILQLNWVYDEYFATPDAWEKVFKRHGIDKIRVLHHRTGRELSTVVQLKIETISDAGVDTSRLDYEICMKCERIKYRRPTRGMFPPLLDNSVCPKNIFKTKEWFGSGHEAHREVIINKKLYQAITDAKLKGASFTPVADTC